VAIAKKAFGRKSFSNCSQTVAPTIYTPDSKPYISIDQYGPQRAGNSFKISFLFLRRGFLGGEWLVWYFIATPRWERKVESAPESRIQSRSNKRSLHRFRYRRPGAKQRHRKCLQYAAQMYTLRATCGSFRRKQEAVRYVLDEFGYRKQDSTTGGQALAGLSLPLRTIILASAFQKIARADDLAADDPGVVKGLAVRAFAGLHLGIGHVKILASHDSSRPLLRILPRFSYWKTPHHRRLVHRATRRWRCADQAGWS